MLLSDTVFLFFYFPLVLAIYYALKFSRTSQNIWLFITGLLFYAWGNPVHVLLLTGSILINWAAGLLIGNREGNLKKIYLIIACLINLGVLGSIKYTGFMVDFINSLFEREMIHAVHIALPIGISFFTLRALSYVIDVYRGTVSAERNPLYVGLYLSFFPQMIAGPITPYHSIAGQIRTREESGGKIADGVCLFLVGLMKKVIIADHAAILADIIFNRSEIGMITLEVPVIMAWIGMIAFALQIYFELSAYSDMAIGLGSIFGFRIDRNFDAPYCAVSVSDFWKRWHISLISWFREYVYLPLGGSSADNKDRMVRNMFIVWLLIGIWHGAGWNFIFWGVWNFVFLLAERFFNYEKPAKHRGWMRVYTLLAVSMGWVLFRTKDLYQAYIYYKNLFGMNGNGLANAQTWFFLKEYWVYLLLGIVCSMPVMKNVRAFFGAHIKRAIAVLCLAGLFGYAVVNLSASADVITERREILSDIRSEKELVNWIAGTEDELHDEMFLHDYFVEIDGIMRRLIGKQEIDNCSLIRDDDGMIYCGSVYSESNDDVDDMTEQIVSLKKMTDSRNEKLIVMLPPAKILYGVSHVDLTMPLDDPNSKMDKLLSQLQQREVTALDLRLTMQRSGDALSDLFFRTDRNWTPRAAFYSMQELVALIEDEYGDRLDPYGYYRDPEHYTIETYEDSMLGSYGKITGRFYSGLDDFELIYLTDYEDTDFIWENHDDKEKRGNLKESLLHLDEMESGDFYQQDMYDVYINELDDHDSIVNRNNETGAKLAVLRDSYFSPTAVFLAPMCSTIDMFRSQDKMSVEAFLKQIEEEHYDYVILEIAPDLLNAETVHFFEEN